MAAIEVAAEPNWVPALMAHSGDAARGLEATMEMARRTGSVPVFAYAAAALAQHHLAMGHANSAASVASSAVAQVSETGDWEAGGEAVAALVEALLMLGQRASATKAAAELREGLEGREGAAARASLALCDGMNAEARGRPDQAATSFASAHRAWQALSRPHEAAVAQERWGRALIATNPTRGADLVAAAAIALEEAGSLWRAARAREYLRSRERMNRGSREELVERLTPREQQVVALAAHRLTNLEIGLRLGISERTVESHVGHARQKLGRDWDPRRGRIVRVPREGR